MGDAPHNEDARKTSCQYAVQISKQFITLASAGVAFVAGLVFSETTRLSGCQTVAPLIAFGLSIAFGLLFLMHVVGKIGRDGDYDVYSTCLRCLAILQIASFVAGVACIGATAMRRTRKSARGQADSPPPHSEAHAGDAKPATPPRSRARVETPGGDLAEAPAPKAHNSGSEPEEVMRSQPSSEP